MRCICCNRALNDYESTLKSLSTGDYLDMCRKCLEGLDIKTMKNTNTADEQAPNEDFWEFPEVEWNASLEMDDEASN
jgi:hypothetical protein